jgi:type II secretory ATPase GspE/PulE/Tfp pilus assembly ATPase PilB-like protein
MGLEPTLISSTLRGVISQRLIRTICPHCKETREPAADLKRDFLITPETPAAFQYGKGCTLCNYTGYLGRIPIVELWVPAREEALFLHKRPDNMTLRDMVFSAAQRHTMLEDGLLRVKSGVSTLDELVRVVPCEQIAEYRMRCQTRLFSWTA